MEKFRRIISQLIAKAQSTDSEAEAETFMSKALELMEKYQIESYELHQEDPIGFTQGVAGEAGQGEYKAAVQTALAHYYGAKPVKQFTTHKRFFVALFGPESSRLTTELMLPFVWKQVCEQGRKWAEAHYYSPLKGVREVAKALCLRIYKETATRKHSTQDKTAFALTVIDATQTFIDAHYGKGNTKSMIKRKTDVWSSAADAAKGIAIAPQIKNGNVSGHLNG